MGKNKLKRFQENEQMSHVVQPTREELIQSEFGLQGNWASDFFQNKNPIIVELGCGKGEYTVGMARHFPNKNFIGVDIKGSRMWVGAKQSQEEEMKNVAFLRMQIQDITYAFETNEVSEIWITFPDPQIKYRRQKLRLTHPAFLKKYKDILQEGGKMHLKTDSEFLFGYTQGVLTALHLPIYLAQNDVYGNQPDNLPPYVSEIQTHYEKIFSEEGKNITYLQFGL